MMIKVMALDDEPLALQQLTSYLEKIPFFEVVGSCVSTSEALEMLEQKEVDALFLDINMPDLNGVDLIKSLTNPPIVVFTTAYTDYAIQGYKINAVDYLLKPFGLADVVMAAQHVRNRYLLLHPEVSDQPATTTEHTPHATKPAAKAAEDDFLFLKSDYKVVRVRISEIIYIKGMSEYLRIYVTTQPKPIIVLLSMKRIEDRLAPPLPFMRIHRSYIINLNHIHEITRAGIVLNTGEEIPVGDTYRTALNEYIGHWSLGK